jgi:alpha-L-fucosidase
LNIPPDKRGLIHNNDIESLRGLNKIIVRTFGKDLSDNSIVKINGNQVSVSKNILFAKDKYWIADEVSGINSFEFILPEAVSFDVVMLQEEIRVGQRIEKFHLEYWNGNEWEKFTEGTTVGYKRLLRFDPVKTDRIRLTINEARLNPTLSNFEIYKLSN